MINYYCIICHFTIYITYICNIMILRVAYRVLSELKTKANARINRTKGYCQ
ncbi:MAG: hypothetical protein EZS26_003733 [Candidatus Ordinivivax streblomastigis]|uniref:Uncharacterized protein n=1 Tax=Candidatus Ordinivivax streblomastigis TaxID=2540710 RepID=A0A5M8NUY9_9BACT|nr:MAG: hypothetical protein EZS26_003733 [Candidatus Ordinivivax streblomastigis]